MTNRAYSPKPLLNILRHHHLKLSRNGRPAQRRCLLAVSGTDIDGNAPFSGYEMHIGVTLGPDALRPLLRFSDGKMDGARSVDDRVRGVYVHGLFADDRQRARWLDWIGAKGSNLAYNQVVEDTLEALAAHLEMHVDVDGIIGLAR